MTITLGRNEPCHCGSGKKYKKCHLAKDEEKEHKALKKTEIKPLGEDAPKDGKGAPPKHKEEGGKGWFKNMIGKGGSLFRPPAHHKSSGGGGA